MATAFYGGNFFGGEFFSVTVATEETVVVHGGKGDNRRRIFKPTGLPPYRARKTVEERAQETAEIHREVIRQQEPEPYVEVQEPPPIATMSLLDIEAEIGERLRAQLRAKIKEEEEIFMLMVVAANA